jgi:hypothetical protein
VSRRQSPSLRRSAWERSGHVGSVVLDRPETA